MGESCAIVLKNHGTLRLARTLDRECLYHGVRIGKRLRSSIGFAAQLGPVQKISTGEVRSVLTGARKADFFAHVWGHYAGMDPHGGQS